MRLETFALAFCAAHEKIAQKLHLNLFKTCARATFAAAVAGIKREGACGESLGHRFRLRGKQFADAIKQTQIKNRGGTRCARQRRLIDHHYLANPVRADHRFARPRFLIRGLSFRTQQIPIKHIMDECGFAGPGNTGHARKHAKRQINVDVFEVVLPCANDLD